MKLREFAAVPGLLPTLLCLALMVGAGPSSAAAFANQSAVLDNDGDSLIDDIDLDDDNDGVMDSEDPEPFNPAVPGKEQTPSPAPGAPSVPAPSVPKSSSDSDGDSLADDIDLDDDNDGVMDSEDPEPFNPAVPGTSPSPSPAPTAPGDGDNTGSEVPLPPNAEQRAAPVVTGLPSTGTGDSPGPSRLVLAAPMLIATGMFLAGMRLRLRQ